jgi:hypothetical protein
MGDPLPQPAKPQASVQASRRRGLAGAITRLAARRNAAGQPPGEDKRQTGQRRPWRGGKASALARPSGWVAWFPQGASLVRCIAGSPPFFSPGARRTAAVAIGGLR